MSTETAIQPQEFTSEFLQFTVCDKPQSKIECTALIQKGLIDKAKAKAVRFLTKHATISGFRKGKAPEALVIQRLPQELENLTREQLARLTALECIQVAKIPALGTEKLRQEEKDLELAGKYESFSWENAKLRFSLEVEPRVPTVDPLLFQPKPINAPIVDDAAIQERIRQLLFFLATWTPITDRPIQEGDFVILDVELIEKNPPEMLFTQTRFEVTDKSMSPWMKTVLLGKNVHDVVEGVSVPEEHMTPEEKALFAPQKVLITVCAIETPILPELTEQVLKQLGLASAEELPIKVEALLRKESNDFVQKAQEEQVSEFLLSTYPFDIPPTYIEKEVNFRWNRLQNDKDFHAEWNHASEQERNGMAKLIVSQSTRSLQLYHLCRKLLQDAAISITEHKNGNLSKFILEKATEYVMSKTATTVLPS